MLQSVSTAISKARKLCSIGLDSNFANKERVGELYLLACVLCFGVSFVIQRVAATNPNKDKIIGPLTYNSLRYVVSTVVVGALLPYLRQAEEKEKVETEPHSDKPVTSELYTPSFYLWFYGGISGVTGFFASNMQQIGLMHTGVAKTAFITSMFVIIVPLIESLLPGGRMAHSTWIAAVVSMLGTYFVSGLAESGEAAGKWSETHGVSEFIILVSMFFWAISIMSGDRGCKQCDAINLTAVDFVVVTVLSLLASFIFESEEWVYPFPQIRSNLVNVIAVGITEAGGFVFCALGQIVVSSSRTALILSLEALSGAFFGYLFLNETLTLLEMFGCIVMSIAFVISSEEWDVHELKGALSTWWYGGGSLYSLGANKSSAVFNYETITLSDPQDIVESGRSIGLSSPTVVQSLTRSASSLRGVSKPTLLGYSEASLDAVSKIH